MGILVSAIITTHNRIKLLEKAIESVKNQTYKNIEIIVVDDPSDSEASVRYTTSDESVKVISLEKNMGGCYARNQGAKAASGEYLAFLDDDDEWFPEKIEKQVEVLERTGGNVCHCGRISSYSDGHEKIDDVRLLGEGDLSQEIFGRFICLTSTMMIRKGTFFQVGGFDENLDYWQDYELCMRLFQNDEVGVVRENLVLYRVNIKDPSRLTNNFSKWEKAMEYVYDKHKDELAILPESIEKRRQLLIANDAIHRCMNAEDYYNRSRYLVKRFLLTGNIKDILRIIKYLITGKYFLGKN